jgi:hypothetical protein
MGRHCAMRRSGSSASGELNQPDPYVSCDLHEWVPAYQVTVVVGRDTTVEWELWNVDSTPFLVEHHDAVFQASGSANHNFTTFYDEDHTMQARVRCQWYPVHQSNNVP